MGKVRSIVGVVVVALAAAALVVGCGQETKEPGTKGPKTTGKGAAEVKAKAPVGEPQTTCPVMGNKIVKTIYADHEGKRVYFCCAACVDAFKKDPAKYVKKLEDAGVTLAKAPAESPTEK